MRKHFNGSGLLVDHNVISGISAQNSGPDGRAYSVTLGVHMLCEGAPVQRMTVSFSAVDRQCGGRNDSAASAGPAARIDDPRVAASLRQSVLATSRVVLAIGQNFQETSPTCKSNYEARVLALANAHRLITEGGWKSTSLTELLRTLLQPIWIASR